MHSRGQNWIRCIGGIAGCVCALLISYCEKSPDDPDENLFNLRITEIHYNPSATDRWGGDSYEFIELKNSGSSTLDIGSIALVNAVEFTFPKNASIGPHGFFVIASDEIAFTELYGFKPDAVFDGQLKNSGESIEIFDWLTETVIGSLAYGDSSSGWPAEADGEGYSLVPIEIDPDENSSDPAKWRRSVHRNGSPGKDDIKLPLDESLYDLRITEIHYHPSDPDTFNGDSLEFIEIKNSGLKELSLARVAFTDGITYAFSDDATIGAGECIVLASNKNKFYGRYKKQPFDVFAGQLSNSGETIVLEDLLSGEVLITIAYWDNAPWSSDADGKGYSLVPYSRKPGRNQNRASAWRRSFRLHGSPGADDPGIVVVNEVVANPPLLQKDAIELYNPGDDNVDISGWFLTDSRSDPVKFVIPDGVTVAAGGFVVFTEEDFKDGVTAVKPFSLSAHGDDVYIMSDSDGCTGSGYCQGLNFEECELGVSIGRYITSSGDETFSAMSAITLGKHNGLPKIGPLIITEIAHSSLDGEADFIEVTNVDYQEVRLYDPQNPDNTWKIDGINFAFPKNSSIASGASIIIHSDGLSTSAFRSRYQVDADVTMYQFAGELPDDKLELIVMKPEEPYGDSTSTAQTVPYLTIDRVKYTENSLWPSLPSTDTDQESLQRKSEKSFGNDPYSWMAALSTPGTFTEAK